MTTRPASTLAGAVIAFDLDGTLVETAPDLLGTLNQIMVEEGLSPVSLEDGRVYIGQGAMAMLRKGFDQAGRHLTEETAAVLFPRFIEIYSARIADESRPYPGLEAALDGLQARGAKLVVCTNKRTTLSVSLLQKLGLLDRFEAVIGADLAPKQKPDASHVIAAVEAAGGSPARAVMVGDSLNDVASARAAGVPSIVFPFGYTEIPAHDLGADRFIHHYDELIDAVEALLQR